MLDLLGTDDPNPLDTSSTITINNTNDNNNTKSNNQDLLDLLGALDLSTPVVAPIPSLTTTTTPTQYQPSSISSLTTIPSLDLDLSSPLTNSNGESSLIVNNILGQQQNSMESPQTSSINAKTNNILDDFTNFNQEVGELS